jgi:hypothetical protein
MEKLSRDHAVMSEETAAYSGKKVVPGRQYFLFYKLK